MKRSNTLTNIGHRAWYAVVFWACAWFFCVLGGYYVLRPVREEMATQVSKEELQQLILAVFVLMLLASPLYSWLVARFSRRLLVRLIYRFFELCLFCFWLVLRSESLAEHPWVPRLFFIWVSVFNLFAVSIFWSFATDVFSKEHAKIFFGVMAAGGTLGAIVGSFAAGQLAPVLGIAGLLWIPLVLLELATFLMAGMHRAARRLQMPSASHTPTTDTPGEEGDEPIGGGIWAGLLSIVRSPYLSAICLLLLMSQLCGTTSYFQQQEIVPSQVADRAQRLKVFADINLWGQVLTVVLQAFVAGHLMRFGGLALTLCILPVVYLASFLALGADPTLLVLAIAQIVQRGTSLGLMVPAEHALFTVVSREDKYKAKSFIDTAIFRGGDVLASWLFVTTRQHWTLTQISYLMVPVVACWMPIAWWLGRQAGHAGKTAEKNERPA